MKTGKLLLLSIVLSLLLTGCGDGTSVELPFSTDTSAFSTMMDQVSEEALRVVSDGHYSQATMEAYVAADEAARKAASYEGMSIKDWDYKADGYSLWDWIFLGTKQDAFEKQKAKANKEAKDTAAKARYMEASDRIHNDYLVEQEAGEVDEKDRSKDSGKLLIIVIVVIAMLLLFLILKRRSKPAPIIAPQPQQAPVQVSTGGGEANANAMAALQRFCEKHELNMQEMLKHGHGDEKEALNAAMRVTQGLPPVVVQQPAQAPVPAVPQSHESAKKEDTKSEKKEEPKAEKKEDAKADKDAAKKEIQEARADAKKEQIQARTDARKERLQEKEYSRKEMDRTKREQREEKAQEKKDERAELREEKKEERQDRSAAKKEADMERLAIRRKQLEERQKAKDEEKAADIKANEAQAAVGAKETASAPQQRTVTKVGQALKNAAQGAASAAQSAGDVANSVAQGANAIGAAANHGVSDFGSQTPRQ